MKGIYILRDPRLAVKHLGGDCKDTGWHKVAIVPLQWLEAASYTAVKLNNSHGTRCMNLTEFFDQIYVINLSTRADRRREMERQFDRVGIHCKHDKIQFFPAVRPERSAGFPSIGAKGCFMSHMNILNEAAARRFDRILILEDDLNFAHDFTNRIDQVLTELAQVRWALFYGGYRVANLHLHADRCVARVPATQAIGTTHFIAFQGGSIAMISNYLKAMVQRLPGDPRGGPMHVDGAYTWFRKENSQYITLIANPELGYQRPSRSDIFLTAWYDQLPILSQGARFFRILKGRILQTYR